MARKNRQHPAVLILDMVSEYRFPDAERILRGARRAARGIVRLKQRAKRAGVPIIYVNDTAGRWESDQRAFIERCLRPDAAGHDVAQMLAPEPDDYFIFKPRHSGFFDTPLATLLYRLHVDTLLLTGITSHQCVLFTGMDAHVRGFNLVVPADCIGAGSAADTRHALYLFEHALNARIGSSRAVRLTAASG
jgi:nicotinamidase-related amidase